MREGAGRLAETLRRYAPFCARKLFTCALASAGNRIAHAAIAAYVDSFKAQCACSAVIKRRRSDAAATGSIFIIVFILRLPWCRDTLFLH